MFYMLKVSVGLSALNKNAPKYYSRTFSVRTKVDFHKTNDLLPFYLMTKKACCTF